MQNREVQQMLSGIKHHLEVAEREKLDCWRAQDERKQIEAEKRELEEANDELLMENDQLRHDLELAQEDNATLRHTLECTDYFVEKGIASYIQQQFDELEATVEDQRQDINQLQDYVKWLKDALEFERSEKEEYKRINGSLKRRGGDEVKIDN